VPAEAVNVALEAFTGIVTLAGTTRPATLELRPTTSALVVAAPLRLTVHVVVAPEGSELDAHPTEVRVTGAGTMMLPPVAETGTAAPAEVAPKAPLTPMEIELVLGASVTVTAAMLPPGIVFVLSPVTRQVYELVPLAHRRLLAAAVTAELGVTEKLVTLAEG